MLLKHVLMRILKGAAAKGTFIFPLTVKLQSKHLTVVGLAQGLSRIAANP
jgi:hypothetical protein